MAGPRCFNPSPLGPDFDAASFDPRRRNTGGTTNDHQHEMASKETGPSNCQKTFKNPLPPRAAVSRASGRRQSAVAAPSPKTSKPVVAIKPTRRTTVLPLARAQRLDDCCRVDRKGEMVRLVASRSISANSLLLTEDPIVECSTSLAGLYEQFVSLSNEQLEWMSSLPPVVGSLQAQEQEQLQTIVNADHQHFPGFVWFASLMKARAVAARGRPDMWALFPTGSFAAHSCEPNAYCRNHTGRLELVALRSIREGEAITLGIIDQLYASTLERRVRLIQNRLAFCYCSRCVGPVDETRRAWCPKCRCAEHGPSEKAPFVVHVGTGWLCTACESKFPEKMVPVSIETTLTQLFHKLNQGFCRPSAQQWTQYLTYLAQTAYQVFGPFHWLTAASHYLRSRYYVASINGGDLSSEALNKALEHGETYLQFVVATSPTGGMLDAVPWASTLMRATLKTGALDLFLDLADQYLPWIALLYGTDDPTVVAYEEAATLAQDVGPAGGVLLSKLQLLAICSERKTPAVETSDPESTAILVERLKKKSLRWKVRPWEKTAPLKRSVSVESVEPRRNSRHFARMACESNEAVGRNCKRPKAHAASRATHERDDEVKLLLRELREGLEELKNERATFEQERKALQKETESHRRKQKALQVHAEAERRKLCEETDAERAKLKAEAAAARELLRSESRARPKRRGSKAVAAKTNIVYDRPQFGSAWEPAETPEVRESGVSHPNEQPDRDRPSGLRTPHRQSYREPYRQPQVNAQPQINAQPQVNAQLHRQPQVNAQLHRQPQVNAQLHRQPQVHAQLHRQPQINAQGSRRHSQGNSPHAQPSVNALAYLHAPPLGYVHPQVHAQSTSQTYIPPMWGVNPSRKSRRKHKRHDRRSAVRSRSDSPQNCSDPTRQSLPQYHMPPVDESFQVVWMPVMPQMVVGTPDFYRRRKHQTESGYKKFLYSE